MLTEERLKQIEERAAAATPGPWEEHYSFDAGEHYVSQVGDGCFSVICADEASARFAAHARTDVPDLVAEVRKLRTILTELVDLWNIAAITPRWASGSPHPMGERVHPAWAAAREALGKEPQ